MATVELNIPQAAMEQNWTPNYLILHLSGLTGSVLIVHDLTGSVKADLCIYSSFVTVPGQCLSIWLL